MTSYSSDFGSIYLGEDFDTLSRRVEEISPTSVFVLADSNTAQYCVPLVHDLFPITAVIVIPAGEIHKNLEQCEFIWSRLIEEGADRHSIILNIGGGMICDLGGFAASCFQRGIRFIHVPTTLLAMTDAAIGGKTAVDFRGYKNYIGLFSRPEFVWINPVFLRTLPGIELNAGMAEMIKHAIIGSRGLWDALTRIERTEPPDWLLLIARSLEVKIKLVGLDPKEAGIRKTLNFGHTVGHALESYYMASSTPLNHGQAVAFGMITEAYMAMQTNALPKKDFEEIFRLISSLIDLPEIGIPPTSELMAYMTKDKKNERGVLKFSLPDALGQAQWDIVADPGPALDWLREQASAIPLRYLGDTF